MSADEKRVTEAGVAFYGSTDRLAANRVRAALDAADAADRENGIHRVRLGEAGEKIRALLVLPQMGDRVNGDPGFCDGWEAASEEVLARLPEILAVLTETTP